MRSPLAAALLLALAAAPSSALAGADTAKSPAASKRDATFCDALAGYVKEAPREFKPLAGAQRKKPTNFTATKLLPGASDCTVYGKTDAHEAFLGCEMSETKDAEIAAASFKALTAKVRACYPGADWEVDEGEHDDGGGFWWSLTNKDASKPFFEVNDDVDAGTHTIGIDVIQPD